MSLGLLLPFLVAYAVVFLLRRALGAFISITATLLIALAQLRFGFSPPLPGTIISIYAAFVLVGIVLYMTSSEELYASFTEPIRKLVLNEKRAPIVLALMVVIPAAIAWKTWKDYQPDTSAPAAFRVVHPAPPAKISVNGKSIDVQNGNNPLRALQEEDPEAFAARVHEGRRVYYQNCYFCHGDELSAQGHFANAVYPRPISFADKTTIPMFTETFLFWRVSKGGPGLPAAATPWDSAMPSWEDFLTNDEMWEAILYLYARTKQHPRVVSGSEGHK